MRSVFCFGVTVLLGVLLLPSTGSAQAGSAYVWADAPTANNYTPSSTYSFNSSGGDITVTRRQVGEYSVRFSGLGGHGSAGGNVQVTAYGPGSEACKVVSWDSGRDDFIVNVRCFTVRGEPVDTRYTVRVTWPEQLLRLPGLVRPIEQDPGVASERRIRSDGTVEIRYPDGRIVEYFEGGGRVIYPDGRPPAEWRYSTGAPVAIPPSLPDDDETLWLEGHANQLVDILRALVADEEVSVDNHLNVIEAGMNIYEKIGKRQQLISYLVRP